MRPERIPPLARFERHIVTQTLVHFFHDKPPQTRVSYATLNQVTGLNIQSQAGRHYLRSARKILEREYQKVLDVVTGWGYVVATGPGVVAISERHVNHVSRTTARDRQRLRMVDPGEMSEPEQRRFVNARAHSDLIYVASSRKAKKAISTLTGRTELSHQEVKARLLAAIRE